MKKLVLIIIFFTSIGSTFAQWGEFNYFALRLGITNQFLNPAPLAANGMFINSYEGDRYLIPDTNQFLKYNSGFDIGLDFHFDWHNDMGGFIIGAEYYNFAVSNKFVSQSSKDYIIRTMRIHCISFPIYMKFGYEIFNLQRYAFLGARFNWNLQLDISEEASWNSEIKTQTHNDKVMTQYNYLLMGGINFLFLNVEADFYPQTFLNKNYRINVGTQAAPYYIKPFAAYPDTYLVITTSLYIPLSPWATTRSYFLNKLAKMF